MTISTGNLVRSRNPGNAQSIIQSFLNSYLAATNTDSPNKNIIFYTGSYPTRTITNATARTTANAKYAGSGFFTAITNKVANVLSESNIANIAGDVISANTGVSLTYPANTNQGITASSFTGFSQIFVGELRRYLIYRRISATTTVTGNIPPAGVYTDSGKALINPSFPGDGTTAGVTVSGWNGGKIASGNIANPSTSANLVPGKIISANSNSSIGGYSSTAFNTYWATLMANWTTAYNNAGTVNLSTSICHGSCHSSCHGSRGRR